MTRKNTRLKTAAAALVCQNDAEMNAFIEQIGIHQRKRADVDTRMNEQLAAVRSSFELEAAPINAVIDELTEAVRIYAEANRPRLINGRLKTLKLAAGEISWRNRPTSVRITNPLAVIAALKSLNLTRFIRTKEEPDKNAMLAEPGAVENVKGVTFLTGEDFVIEPFNTDLGEVRA